MESFLSAIASDLLSRALSMVIQRYRRSKAEEAEHKLQRLQCVLLRIDALVEEAEGRHITNQAMLQQLEMLRQGMYGGHYMLDTFRYKGHGGDDEVSGGRAVALPRFSSPKLLLSFPDSNNVENQQNTVVDSESIKKLEKILHGIETMIGDMKEFVVFLEGSPRICRQPYDTYLILEKVMFGRQMEMETVINFLLRPESADNRNPGVLPIVGLERVGKSTLVEHVCLDERVRTYFSSIVLFTGDDLDDSDGSGVINHRNRTAPSCGRSLAVIELSGDMEEETWRRLYSSAASSMGHGSKIIVTSRSEKIVALGTVQTLSLKILNEQAYWYFFKALVFGSTNPSDQPKLASLAMEIAMLLKGSFLGANIMAGLMRSNLNAQLWRRVLQCLRDYTKKHLLMFGEHPADLVRKGKPVYIWRMARTQHVVVFCKVYEKRSPQRVPKLTTLDILTGCVTHQGKFSIVAWRSSIPPYYTYLTSCASLTAEECLKVNKKRPRQERV